MNLPESISVSPGWYHDASLVNATLEQWHQADYYQGLAACSYFVRSAAGLNGKPAHDDNAVIGHYASTIDFSLNDLLDHSAILMRAITEGTANFDPSIGLLRVDYFAHNIMFELGWLTIHADT